MELDKSVKGVTCHNCRAWIMPGRKYYKHWYQDYNVQKYKNSCMKCAAEDAAEELLSYGEILEKAKINPEKRVSALTEDEVAAIRSVIQADYKVEGALRSEVQMNIKRLMDIGAYRGLRHRRGLPTRGQRTRTNSRTRKGKRKTVAGKKKVAAKK